MDLVIFDCDGVLIDSEILWATIEAEALTRAGFPITPLEYARRYAGLTHQVINKKLEADHGFKVESDHPEKMAAAFQSRLATDLKVLPGAYAALASIACKRCIASNSMLDYLDKTLTLTGLRGLFTNNIYSARECGNRQTKPDPNVFLHALKMMGGKPQASVIVEDSVHGVEAARLSGVAAVIGFTGAGHSSAGHGDRLRHAGATHIAASMTEVTHVLRQIGVPVAASA
jgi:HAD superfamily hydrolase (TIGR01509 family)